MPRETFQKAEKSLSEAEAYQTRNAGRKPVAMTAREAVQMAEDSRTIAVKRQEDEALAARTRKRRETAKHAPRTAAWPRSPRPIASPAKPKRRESKRRRTPIA